MNIYVVPWFRPVLVFSNMLADVDMCCLYIWAYLGTKKLLKFGKLF